MTPERAKELLPVIQAFAEGKTVQTQTDGDWRDSDSPEWILGHNYRIKREPREWWLVDALIEDESPRRYRSRTEAETHAKLLKPSFPAVAIIHVREVL